MKKPNFFILGEPKSGTSSLAAWLSDHPNVFITEPKEPWFFNTDVAKQRVDTWTEYENLYSSVGYMHQAVGEASTLYIWSRRAVPQILNYVPHARFIVMLRFPPDMAVSLHAQECRAAENIRDFAAAWSLQKDRARGHHLPRFAPAPDMFQYGDRCRVGSHLARLFEQIPANRVLVVFLEDLSENVEREWRRVTEFLGVPDFKPEKFDVENERRDTWSLYLPTVLNGLGWIKRYLGVRRSSGLLAPLFSINLIESKQKLCSADLPSRLKAELGQYFRPEIEIVEQQLGRVPHSWHEKLFELVG